MRQRGHRLDVALGGPRSLPLKLEAPGGGARGGGRSRIKRLSRPAAGSLQPVISTQPSPPPSTKHPSRHCASERSEGGAGGDGVVRESSEMYTRSKMRRNGEMAGKGVLMFVPAESRVPQSLSTSQSPAPLSSPDPLYFFSPGGPKILGEIPEEELYETSTISEKIPRLLGKLPLYDT